MEVKKEHVDKVFELAKLSLSFAKVNRATHHEDGVRNESDTDHTFMLSLIACSLADVFYKEKLDIGLVSQYALVHDLVEAYAGDTNSFVNTSPESRKEKDERERASFEKIKSQIAPEFSWATNLIEKYESQQDKEGRYVKLVDKITPDLTHVLSNFSYVDGSGMGKEYFYNFIENKVNFLNEKYKYEFPEIIFLYKSVIDKMFSHYEDKNK